LSGKSLFFGLACDRAEESMKAGKDASGALKKADESLLGEAKWSGTELKLTRRFLQIPPKRFNPESRRQSGDGADPHFSQYLNDFLHIDRPGADPRFWP
jgi:hypothetical protein